MRAVHHAAAWARLFPAPSQVGTASLPLTGHSFGGKTESLHFPLRIDAIDTQYSVFFTVTKAKARCILSDQFFLSLVLRLR